MKNNQPDGTQNSICPAPEDLIACLCNELKPAEKAAVEKHIETCASCRALAGGLGDTIQELKECAAGQELHRDLTDEILHRIPGDEWKPHNTRGFADRMQFNLLLRLAACFIIIFGAVIGIRSLMPGTSQPGSVAVSSMNPTKENSSGSLAKNSDARSTAVKDTLQWLASVQEPSGRWDAASWGGQEEYSLALNGLVLLTFVRNPALIREYAPVIDRAVKYMLRCQDGKGLFGGEFERTMYNHGIVTVALLETYSATGDLALKAPLDKAVSFIRQQQSAVGGWSYISPLESAANTSISVWQLQALLLSVKLGWEDQEYSLRRGLRWLSSIIDGGEQFGYDRSQGSPAGTATLTAMGAFCLSAASEAEMPCNGTMLSQLKNAIASSKIKDESSDFYRCYFRAAAFNAAKTEECKLTLAELQHTLLVAQERSGGNAGTWSPNDQWGLAGGRMYSTAVAALALQVNHSF